MQSAINAFVANLAAERGLSPHTLAAYRSDLTPFAAWLARRGLSRPDQVSPDDAVAFLALLRGQGMASATMTRKAAVLRLFAAFLCREGLCTRDFTATLDTGRPRAPRLPTTLSVAEMERLLAAPASPTAGRSARQGHAGNDVRQRPPRLRTGCAGGGGCGHAGGPRPALRQGG